MRWLPLSLALLVAVPIAAQDAQSTSAREISHLISHLESSNCRFNRNGKWYSTERAVRHLQRKYEWLRKRDLVPTAEAFLERAASKSSSSGKPYWVQCGDAPAVASGAWLGEELARFRNVRAD